jgi:thiamine biosynthesis lipoprotein ApbE
MNDKLDLNDPETRRPIRLAIAAVLMHASLSNPAETQAVVLQAQGGAMKAIAESSAVGAEMLLQKLEELETKMSAKSKK